MADNCNNSSASNSTERKTTKFDWHPFSPGFLLSLIGGFLACRFVYSYFFRLTSPTLPPFSESGPRSGSVIGLLNLLR
jgi:hypothetical protein